MTVFCFVFCCFFFLENQAVLRIQILTQIICELYREEKGERGRWGGGGRRENGEDWGMKREGRERGREGGGRGKGSQK